MYDLAIIGGGPGGYTAAIRGAQAGLKVVLVEKDVMGGTCLNRGCIPTKSYIYDTKTYVAAGQADFLVGGDTLRIDLAKLVSRKQKVVKKMVGGLVSIFKSYGIEIITGTGRLLDSSTIAVESKTTTVRQIQARAIILATGSRPAVPTFIDVDGKVIVTTDQALDPKMIPKNLVIIGGGVIGIEMATIYNRLGSKITILEMLPDILTGEDLEIRRIMKSLLKRHDVALHLKASVKTAQVTGKEALVSWKDESGKQESIRADQVLVATGRAPVLNGIDSARLDLKMNGPFIRVDSNMNTSLPGVWAIGDLVGGMMLAHKASAEAEVAVEDILGRSKRIHNRPIPRCIWGFTEIGSVGVSEEEAGAKDRKIHIGKFPFTYSGAAQAMGEPDGLVKTVADKETGEILGVHIIGSHATDLISEAVAVMTMEGVVEDLAEAIHPHPTFSETLMEAALDWNKISIHAPRK